MKWRSVASSAWDYIRSHLRLRSPRAWALQAIPLALLISLLVSPGSFVQEHLFKALTGDAPSIYAAVYSKGLIRFPSFTDWLSVAAYPQFLAIGLLTAHMALLRRRLWAVLAATAIWTAALLTALDVGSVVIGDSKIADLPASVIGNTLGGIAVGVVVGFALPLFRRLPAAFPEAKEGGILGAAAGTILMGVILSYLVWYALRFFFQPVPVDLSVVLDPPVGGYIGGGPKLKLLSFLPDADVAADLELQSTGAEPIVRWAAAPKHSAYNVTAHLLAACLDPDLSKFSPGAPTITWQNVRSVSVHFDSGFTLLKGHGGQGSRFWFDRQLPSRFWLKKVGKDGLEVTHFVTEDEVFSSSTAGELKLLMTAELVKIDHGRGYIAPRQLSITVDGRDTVTDFQHVALPVRPAPCSPMGGGATSSQSNIQTPYSAVSVLLTFTPASSEADRYDVHASKFTITGASGWERVSPLSEYDLVNSMSGSTDALFVTGKPLLVELDGERQQASEFDSLLLYGKVDASILDGRRVRFDGNAKMLWRGDVRMNPTKWERLPNAIQMALLPALIAVLGFLLRVIWWPAVRDFRDEDVNAWV